jgi:hypothetical protein
MNNVAEILRKFDLLINKETCFLFQNSFARLSHLQMFQKKNGIEVP